MTKKRKLRPGDRVRVPFPLETVEGKILEVWGDAQGHIRVAFELGGPEEPDLIFDLLLREELVEPIRPAS